MSKFALSPPSDKPPLAGLFRGGMMPAAPTNVAGLIIFDLRSLNLPQSEGKAIEQVLRDTLVQELQNRGVLQNRSAIDLSGSVFGIAID